MAGNLGTRRSVAKVEHEVSAMLSSRGGGTEHKLRFGGSVTKAEYESGGTLPCRGGETKQNLIFGRSLAERPSTVEVERNKTSRLNGSGT